MKHDPMLVNTSATPAQALKVLTEMVRDYQKKSRAIEKAAERMKVMQEAANEILEKQIPDYMAEMDISEVRLSDGAAVKCVGKVFASIAAKNKDKAHKWLRNNGHDDIIKNVVTATYGKGQLADAVKLEQRITADGFTVVRKESVHNSTLQAWVRDMNENAKRVPAILFGTFEKQVVTIGKTTKSKGNK